MLQELAIAVFTQNEGLYRRLADAVKDLGVPTAQFAYGDRPDSVNRWAGDGNLIALLDADPASETCVRWIRRLADIRPDAVSIWMEGQFNQGNVVEAVRAGARDLLVGEFTNDDVRSLVKRAADSLMQHRVSSMVLGVLGSAGGAGVSTLVTNLAVEIARHTSATVGVLDLDPRTSGVGLLLNLDPDVTLYDLREHADDMDSSLLKRALAEHPSGVGLIAAKEWPLEQLPIPEKIVRRVLLRMQQMFSCVLIDLPRDFSPAFRVALDASDALMLVSPHSMTGAAGTAYILDALDRLDYPRHRILWAANAVAEPAALTIQQLRSVVSRKPFAQLPFSPGPINQAAGQGESLAVAAPRASITKSVRKLAGTLCRSFGPMVDGAGGPEPTRPTVSFNANSTQAGAV